MGVSLTLVSKVTDLVRWQCQNMQCLKKELNYCSFTTPGLLLSHNLVLRVKLHCWDSSDISVLILCWKCWFLFQLQKFLPFLTLRCYKGDGVFWVWTGVSSETIEISPRVQAEMSYCLWQLEGVHSVIIEFLLWSNTADNTDKWMHSVCACDCTVWDPCW